MWKLKAAKVKSFDQILEKSAAKLISTFLLFSNLMQHYEVIG